MADSTTVAEDAIIGSVYLFLAACMTAANLPCLYVMVHEKEMWKKPCIKVSSVQCEPRAKLKQMMVSMGIADQVCLCGHAILGVCTLTRVIHAMPYW